MIPKPRLLDEVRAVCRMRHLSIRTEHAYVQWIKRYIFFHHKRHPREMSEPEIRQFISHLAVEGRITASTQTVALSALLFLSIATFSRSILKIFPTLNERENPSASRLCSPREIQP